MKFTLTFKTPDVTDKIHDDFDDSEDIKACLKVVEKYVKWGEYITVEFDTETQMGVAVRV